MNNYAVADWACVGLAALAVAGCEPTPSAPSDAEIEAISDTILSLASSSDDAVSETECLAALEFFGDREPLVVSDTRIVRSRAEMRDLCGQTESGIVAAQTTIEAADVHVLSRDAAYVVRSGPSFLEFEDGSELTIFLVMTGVWARTPDGWKRMHYHESSGEAGG